ncbi:MAG: hypothetical protein RI885_2342 [Actinomycetota bacterium]
MACNEGEPFVSNEGRVAAWRRILRLGEQGARGQQLVRPEITPVAQVADLRYTAGRPGWRGVWFSCTSPSVAARRSAVLIGSTRAPTQIRWLNLQGDSAAWGIVTVPVGLAGILNPTTPGFIIDRGGDPELANVYTTVGQAQSGGGSTVLLRVGDCANNFLANGIVFTIGSGLFPYPMAGGQIDLLPNECLFIRGQTDATAISVAAEVAEFKDWNGP